MAAEGLAGNVLSPSGVPGGGGETKVSFTRSSIKYDSPFLDMTNTFIPKTIKGMFRFIASSILSDPLVYQCIARMSEYPITSLKFTDQKKSFIEGDKTVDKWKDIFEKKLKFIKVMHQIGMDYHAYGSSLISIHFPFKRLLTCKKCNTINTVESETDLEYKNYIYKGKCSSCGSLTDFEISDMQTKETDKLSIILWDLMFIEIKYNNITNEHFFYYQIPPFLVEAVKKGDLDIVNSLRIEILDAVKQNKQLKLKNDNVFYFKQPGPQYFYPSERGWGIPTVLPVLKDVFHLKILKKGNEMISLDHIVPLRIIFPQGTGDVSPHATINLTSWRQKIEEELRKWKVDPNHISIMPLPVGFQTFSGEARLLMTTPEIKQTEDGIITGMGVIPEIIRGGASWSGSNVSLRIVENRFINHRTSMHELIDWVKNHLAIYFNIPEIDIKMSPFKMADDIQRKGMLLQASSGTPSQRVVSRTTAIQELDMDPETEFKNIMEETSQSIELRIEELEGEASAGGKAGIIQQRFNADAQVEFNNKMYSAEQESRERHNKSSINKTQEDGPKLSEEMGGVQQFTVQQIIMMLTQRFATLSRLSREEFTLRMFIMSKSMPHTYQEVYKNLKELQMIEADLLAGIPQIVPIDPETQQPVTTEQDQVVETEPIESQSQSLPEQLPPRSPTAGI
jgi:RNase P subunit RPR2